MAEHEQDTAREPQAADGPPTADASQEQAQRSADAVAPSASLGQRLQRVAWLAIAIVFTIFAVVNAQAVDFNWIFGSAEVVERGGERVSGGVPLIILLVVSFALGAVVAWLASWRQRRQQIRRVRESR